MIHMLKQKKGAYIDSETKKAIPMQGDKFSPGCEDALFLGKEVSWAQHPFLCG